MKNDKQLVWYGTVGLNVPLDISQVISEMIYPVNQLTRAKNTGLPQFLTNHVAATTQNYLNSD